MKKIIFLYGFLLVSMAAFCQEMPAHIVVNSDTIVNATKIENRTYLFIDSIHAEPGNIQSITAENFVPMTTFNYNKSIRQELVTSRVYMTFHLRNNTDSIKQFYYYPGYLFEHINLYQKHLPSDSLQLIEGANIDGYLLLNLRPREELIYLVDLGFCKTNFNKIKSVLITPQYLPVYKLEFDQSSNDRKSVGLVLSGVLMMMILFTLVNYFITWKIEFLFNCFYSISMGALIFLTAYLTRNGGWFKVFFIGYFDQLLLVLGTVFYLAFTRKFLNTKINFPNLDKFLIIEEWTLCALMALYTFLYYFTDHFRLQDLVENVTKVIALAAGSVYVFLVIYRKNKLMTYLAIGTGIQLALSMLSLIFIWLHIPTSGLFTSPIFYFEIGVIISVVFFLLGLTYKNRLELIEKIKDQEAMKLEVEKKGFETKLAVINAQQEERNRISADMHDDLGAGMTTIRLYSELAKNRIGDVKIPEIDKISSSADELLIKMNAIIWSMSSSNDSLGNMVAYIRSYALEYFEDTDITCKMDIPQSLPNMEVNGEIRRNVFLVVKEALHNVVKHSGATEVRITMEKRDRGLGLKIEDNGKGIDLDHIRMFGNGLKNMKKRMEAISMDFSIENNNGTTIRIFRQTM